MRSIQTGREPETVDYEIVIGLEVHAQLITESKLFCGCSTAFGESPNSNTCPVCLGLPGVLPVLNKQVVAHAIRLAIALECAVNKRSTFARKNYFYPDLPKGYQISQYDQPLAENGEIRFSCNGEDVRVAIKRIHLEEDAGKSIHHAEHSAIDLNRAGVPLVEIVSEPDIREPHVAYAYLLEIKKTLRYLEICDCNMEEGSLRCDANISIRRRGAREMGVKTELKNMNSFRNVEKAIHYEFDRQRSLLEAGEEVKQGTRLWNDERGATALMREKEEAHDYRYFPEPDLPPLVISDEWIEETRKAIPELPYAKQQRFMEAYGLPSYDAEVLTADKAVADYYEAAARYSGLRKELSNWIMGDLFRSLKSQEDRIAFCPIAPEQLAELVELIADGTISGKQAKEVFEVMYEEKASAKSVIDSRDMRQLSDTDQLRDVITQVIREHPEAQKQYLEGKKQALNFFIGEVMKATRGKANPELVNQLLLENL